VIRLLSNLPAVLHPFLKNPISPIIPNGLNQCKQTGVAAVTRQ
jgi:hypothetical protein